ncbi:unnamed protein product [Polarella glacialis]|uniref:Uncharacterized protein n=1 Tax=Polarella glacialis TaxID=89957 RepID=A0A813EIJ3_POLGL|nr:unnamed protein product [Polarella glacialis]
MERPCLRGLLWIAVETRAQGTRNETHDRKLVIIPVQMGVFTIVGLVIGYVFLVLGRVMEFLDSGLINLFLTLSAFGFCGGICRFCRRYSQDRLELSKQIAQFTVAQADCHCPHDYEFIKAMIACLYSETLNEIEGIAAFEHAVRSRVQQNVDKILGSRLHVHWRMSVSGMFLQCLLGLDAVAETLMIPSHLADSRVLADRTARQAARSFTDVCVVHAFLYCAVVTSCLLPECKSKLAECVSNAMFVFVTVCFLGVCAGFISQQFYEMPALASVPLNLAWGLMLLSGPSCCNYMSCRCSFRMHGGPSIDQEAGREAGQEPGEHESREETQGDEGDCEQILEPRGPQGSTYMNIMAPLPKAEILGNAMSSEMPVPAFQPSPLIFSQSCYCCEPIILGGQQHCKVAVPRECDSAHLAMQHLPFEPPPRGREQ